jgi:DNA-binding MarR family transcriptional regulator
VKSSPREPASAGGQARAAAEAVLDTVPSIMHVIRGRMREGRIDGVSVPQFRALLFVHRNPGTDLSSVAEHMGASMPALSELVSRLVRDGLIVREADPASRRRIRLTTSADGERQLAVARERTLDWMAERLGPVPPDQLERIDVALRSLLAVLDETAGE